MSTKEKARMVSIEKRSFGLPKPDPGLFYKGIKLSTLD
jgi:hypothetical protein